MQELAKDLYQQKSLLIMGRGYNFATCLEGALVSAAVYDSERSATQIDDCFRK